MERVYFNNLYGLRFIAALMVFVAHVERIKYASNLPNMNAVPAVFKSGGTGVTLFFVLSGFLITSLLLEERRHAGRIDVWNFYIRRALRIWPLYFLTVAVTFFLLPCLGVAGSYPIQPERSAWWLTLAGYLFFVPNVVQHILPVVPYAGHLWSIGVEEQFYVLWPLLLASKHFVRWIAYIILGLLAINLSLFELNRIHADSTGILNLKNFFYNFRFHSMAIGGCGALLLFRKHELLAAIYAREVQLAALGLSIYFLATPQFLLLYEELQSLCFVIVIMNCVGNAESVYRLETAWLRYLGKISYGIYMFHVLAIKIVLNCMSSLDEFEGTVVENTTLYLLSFAFTIALASISYHFFERRFLLLKERYSSITSG